MKRIFVASAAGMAIALAGCGDTGPNEFADQVKEAMKPVEQSAKSNPSDPAEIAKFADALDESAGRLRDLDPPDGSEDELDAAVKAIERGADRFREAGAAIKNRDREALAKVETNLTASMDEISEAGQALETSVKN